MWQLTSTRHRKRVNMGTMDLHLNHVCCYSDLILAVNPDKQLVFLLLWRGKTTDKKTCRYYCCLIMVRWHIWGSSNTCLFDGKFSYSPAGLLLSESHSWRACFKVKTKTIVLCSLLVRSHTWKCYTAQHNIDIVDSVEDSISADQE